MATDSSRDVKTSVEQQFTQVAANYRTSAVHAGGADLHQLVQIAALTGKERVLDAGCGPGHTALALAPFARGVVAVDLSPAMLAQGRSLAESKGIANVEFRLGDVEDLPFDDGSFDLVTSRYSAHHWPDPIRALREFSRVLARSSRGARLLLADVVSFEEFTLDTHLQTMELLRDPSHVRDHTVEQWHAMLRGAGFRPQVRYSWDLRLDFRSWVERMATPPAAVAMIQALLANAPLEVRNGLRVEPDGSFTFRCALLEARLE